MASKAFLINRDTYRAVKRMDHRQMSDYLGRVYQRGWSAAMESLQKPKPADAPPDGPTAAEPEADA